MSLHGNCSGQSSGSPGDQSDCHRESQDDRDPSPNGSALCKGEEHRGNQVAADQRGQQEQTDNCARAVRRGKRSNRLRRNRAVALLCGVRKCSAHIDLAEEALRRNGDERVGRRSRDVPAVDVALLGGLDQIGFAGIVDQIKGVRVLVLDGADHRRRPSHAERHVARLQKLHRIYQTQSENSGEHQNRMRVTTTPFLTMMILHPL